MWAAKIVMELLKVKTARFKDVVAKCGKPRMVTLWVDPKGDKPFQRALRQDRILSVHQTLVGSRKDFGEVGFVKGTGVTYLEFDKSLKEYSGRRIIGIDYSLLEQPPEPEKPFVAPKKKAASTKLAAPEPKRNQVPKTPKLQEKKVPPIRDKFMVAALDEALKGLKEGGIPIGSALVKKGKLVGVGHNKRVQDSDPVTHAETDCLRNAGRLGSYRGCTLYSTLMPCYFCAGAAVQFGIKKVVVGESRNFSGAPEFMRQHGIEVVDLDLPQCYEMMEQFIREQPQLWNEDIGVD